MSVYTLGSLTGSWHSTLSVSPVLYMFKSSLSLSLSSLPLCVSSPRFGRSSLNTLGDGRSGSLWPRFTFFTFFFRSSLLETRVGIMTDRHILTLSLSPLAFLSLALCVLDRVRVW